MRMSCNGCRVLRKGCSDKCTIRPCLEWIRSPEAQANATVFLAKFYGRAGLVNLINAGAPNLRPAILKSLLYEACGRIVDPISGSVGLLCSGTWKRCQDAVDAVLAGSPITDIVAPDESDTAPPLKLPYDIRHVSNKDRDGTGLNQLQSRRKFKRSGKKRARVSGSSEERSPSHHGSSLSHQSAAPAETNAQRGSSSSRDSACPSSSETHVADPDDRQIDLNLTLGLEPVKRCVKHRDLPLDGDAAGLHKMELRLQLPMC